MDMSMQSMIMQNMIKPGTQMVSGGSSDSGSETAVSDGEGSGLFSGMLKEMQNTLQTSEKPFASAENQPDGQEESAAVYVGAGMFQAALWWNSPLTEMTDPTLTGLAVTAEQMTAVSGTQPLATGQGAADITLQSQADAGLESGVDMQIITGQENAGDVQTTQGEYSTAATLTAAAGEMEPEASMDHSGTGVFGERISMTEEAQDASARTVQDFANADLKNREAENRTSVEISDGTTAGQTLESASGIKVQALNGGEDGKTESSGENVPDGSAGVTGNAEHTRTGAAAGQGTVSETLHLSGTDRTADIQKLLDMTEKAFVSDKGEISLQLEPEHLGKITIKAVYEHGTASVLITCSDPGGAERLSHYAADLGVILQERMGQPTEVIVDRQPDSYTEQYDQNPGREDRQESAREQSRRQKDRSRELDGDFLHQLRLGIM
ncbi:MAG TPA: flagellar hook-length control protein FliK [Candidatus Mediterraneibacter norfolkensis]|nr:flagellar hook-length control protein FliK [Candidatus Mediterraneibacter norfolkensis]